jgi:hypothetical protein
MQDMSATILFTCLLTGCAAVSHKDASEDMYIKASALTKLSSSVEGVVRYENPPANLTDDELLKLSVRDDPTQLEPFAGYVLKVNREFDHAIVLVCNSDGTQGLLEDVGCTAKLDKHLWQQNVSCTFTLSSDIVCASN